MTDTTVRTNVLLIGGGGREHAIAQKLRQSPRLGELYCTHPENPGIAALATPVDVPVHIREIYRLQQFCEKKKIGLVVIGPEDPLAEGYADKLATAQTLVFGPRQDSARIESDKGWSKQLMRQASIPTAEARVFSDFTAAEAYVTSREHPPVIKASGLAKGKGVIVPNTTEEAIDALRRVMINKEFGDAGGRVVIEERLEGPEASLLAIVDGRNIVLLPPAQDHKRLLDGDRGPNTGGMGAFCPTHSLDAVLETIETEVLVPTLDALRREGLEYCGVLYCGLMLTPAGPKVLEFNARFGDPECQAILVRLKSDLLELLLAACTRELDKVDVEWDSRVSCCVVLASEGYPEKPKLNVPIHGLDEASSHKDVFVHLAGVKTVAGKPVTAGGRVLTVTALGTTLEDARAKAYAAADMISFQGKVFRTDIGRIGGV